MSRDSDDSGKPPALGVGITYSSVIVPLLERRPELFGVVEIEPQTTWIRTPDPARPYIVREEVVEHLLALPGRTLIHRVGAPVGGSVRPDAAQFALLRDAMRRFDAPWISDHLSFNQTPEFATGFFLPPRQTPAGIEMVAEAIRDLRRAVGAPLAVETGVNYLRPRADEMRDGEFVR